MAHRCNEFVGAGRDREAFFGDARECCLGQIPKQGDALAQGGLEIQFAAHRPFRDLGDTFADAGECGDLVDAFLLDDG
mgnify:CR=1 FL=1